MRYNAIVISRVVRQSNAALGDTRRDTKSPVVIRLPALSVEVERQTILTHPELGTYANRIPAVVSSPQRHRQAVVPAYADDPRYPYAASSDLTVGDVRVEPPVAPGGDGLRLRWRDAPPATHAAPRYGGRGDRSRRVVIPPLAHVVCPVANPLAHVRPAAVDVHEVHGVAEAARPAVEGAGRGRVAPPRVGRERHRVGHRQHLLVRLDPRYVSASAGYPIISF